MALMAKLYTRSLADGVYSFSGSDAENRPVMAAAGFRVGE